MIRIIVHRTHWEDGEVSSHTVDKLRKIGKRVNKYYHKKWPETSHIEKWPRSIPPLSPTTHPNTTFKILPEPPPMMGYCRSPFLGWCVYPEEGQGCVAPTSDRASGRYPPDLFHICTGGFERMCECVPIPEVQYDVFSANVHHSNRRLQEQCNLSVQYCLEPVYRN